MGIFQVRMPFVARLFTGVPSSQWSSTFVCRLYDSAELQKHPNLVAKILMQCPTESSRRRMMQGLEQKYGPEVREP